MNLLVERHMLEVLFHMLLPNVEPNVKEDTLSRLGSLS